MFFLAEEYSAQRAYEMGAVNRVVPHEQLEREAVAMARTILTKSPTAKESSIRMNSPVIKSCTKV